jgi:hypothetical protein
VIVNAPAFNQAVFPPVPVREVTVAAHDPSWVLVGPSGGGKVKYICTTCGTSAEVPSDKEPPQGRHS